MAANKARNGDGSIRRAKDGKTYIVEISVGYRPDGSRRRTRRTARTLEQAKKLRIELLRQQQQGLLTEQRIDTVNTYGLWWAGQVKPDLIRPTTATDYEDRLRRYVLPYLGNVRMVDLTPQHVQKWIHRLRADGKSPSTVNGARRVLFGLCKHAERQGVIARNPVAATDPVRKDPNMTQVRQPWTFEETRKVLEQAVGEPRLDCFLHLMLHLGLRPGEALGLRWQDIDEVQQTISITGTLKEARAILPDGRGIVRQHRNQPKTKHSARTIAMDDALIAALQRQRLVQIAQRAEAGDRWVTDVDADYVITNAVGRGTSISNLRKRYMAFLASIGVRYIRMHDLRHTVAKLALEADIPIEHVSQTIGHTRIDTTKQIYAGFVPRYTANFVHVMGNLLPPAPIEIPDTLEPWEIGWADLPRVEA